MTSSWEILTGDCRDLLAGLPASSVHTVVTSPPYFGLRDYGTGEWEGGDPTCEHAPVRRGDTDGKAWQGGLGGERRDNRPMGAPNRGGDPRSACRCGARRADQQIGLEPTPDEFVEALVAVFRDLRRVLRDDGTVWLNLGDSYSSQGGKDSSSREDRPYSDRMNAQGEASANARMREGARRGVVGVKPKDLIGIPWAVAQALRAPDYHGRIRAERDRVWLAATLDAEGSICGFTHVRADDGSTRTGVHVTITNTVERLLDEADRIWPASRVEHENHGEGHHGSRPSWRWVAHGAEDKALLMRELYPYLIAKREQARLAHAFFALSADAKRLGHSPQRDAVREKRAWIVDALSRLNRGEGVDVPAWVGVPPSVETTGWYLRSDIIWAKSNPMPESVTDRPTRSHEFIFLLTKSARYHYDADSIRESHAPAGPTNPRAAYGGRMPSEARGEQADTPSKLARGGDGGGFANASYHPAGRNRRDVWTVSTKPYPGAHFACVDAGTEALTPDGWRAHDELRDGDRIAAYDPTTGLLTWQPATFHRYDYDGDLVVIEKRDMSQRLTPNHRCIVRSARGVDKVVMADELTPGMRLPVAAHLEMPNSPRADLPWAALLGWWIAEGHDRGGNAGRIYQSESANPQHVETIRGLLTEVGADFTERRREREWRGRPSIEIEFRLRGQALDTLRRLAPGRTITQVTLDWATGGAARRALLDALIDGDGHRRQDGRASIVQRDRDSIDMMQALAVSVGERAHISRRADGVHVLYLTGKRWITLRGTNGTHEPIGREHYEGIVWCPSVSTTFWLARRDGKPFITGNTFPPDLIEPCVLAGCPERACSACGAPWERIVERTAADVLAPASDYGNGAGRNDGGRSMLVGASTRTLGFEPSCACNADPAPGVVLDPFAGAGTTGLVAVRHRRSFIGLELNAEYAQMARDRIGTDIRLGHRAPQRVEVDPGQIDLFEALGTDA